MKFNDEWEDFEVIATGDKMKLERWKDIILLRPDPQVIWPANTPLDTYKGLNAKYNRLNGGGSWEVLKPMSDHWVVKWRKLRFQVKPMGFKHTGLFPEQAVNWAEMIEIIESEKTKNPDRKIKILNLFAYTGGATVACTSAGAEVTHVDSAKNMVEVAKENIRLSKLVGSPVRYIVDDCKKFVEKEIRRGNTYDAIIMDPPSYGRGTSGEMWKIEDNIFELVSLCVKLLSLKPLFFLINSYTTGLQPTVIKNLLFRTLESKKYDRIECDEVGIMTKEKIVLPCGCSGICIF